MTDELEGLSEAEKGLIAECRQRGIDPKEAIGRAQRDYDREKKETHGGRADTEVDPKKAATVEDVVNVTHAVMRDAEAKRSQDEFQTKLAGIIEEAFRGDDVVSKHEHKLAHITHDARKLISENKDRLAKLPEAAFRAEVRKLAQQAVKTERDILVGQTKERQKEKRADLADRLDAARATGEPGGGGGRGGGKESGGQDRYGPDSLPEMKFGPGTDWSANEADVEKEKKQAVTAWLAENGEE